MERKKENKIYRILQKKRKRRKRNTLNNWRESGREQEKGRKEGWG